MNVLIAAGVTLVVIIGSIILLAVPGIVLSARTKQRMTASAGTTPPATPAGNAPAPTPALAKKFNWNWKLTAGAVVLAAFLLWYFWGTIAGWMPGSTKDVLNQGLPTSITGKTWFGGIILGITLGWLSDTKFSGISKTIGSVFAWILIAICLWMTPVSVYEFFVGTRHRSVPQETSLPAASAPAIPAGAMEMVTVPFCNGNKTWSTKIPLHGSRWQMTPSWSGSTTKMSFFIDGKWSKATSSALSGASHIRYCTVSNELAGESMSLSWKWLGN